MNRTFALVMALLLAPFAVHGAAPAASDLEVIVRDAAGLHSALPALKAGMTLKIAPGEYSGDNYVSGVERLTIEALDPKNPPVFKGGAEAWHFSRCTGLTLRNLRVTGQRGNGLNLDDGGDFKKTTTGITLDHIDVSDIGPSGNHDGIKCSGLDGATIRDCTITGWGGQGIDWVGCHRSLITGCRIVGKPGYTGDAGIQLKGGSSEVRVEKCHLVNAGGRPIQVGGDTGKPFFRPQGANYEARGIIVRDCVIEGGLCAAAFTVADGAEFTGNTILFPEKWIFRILGTPDHPEFIPCRNVLVKDNRIVFRRAQVPIEINVGPGTAPETFRFEKNLWFAEDNPAKSKPRLPAEESGGSYGRDPRALDVADFGALPNDGKCDTLAIEAAIQAARRSGQTEIRFAAGTYNLTRTVTGQATGKDSYIGVTNAANLAFVGATDAGGRPATRLERDLVLDNDAMPPYQVSIQHSRNITLRNFILANNPPLGSTARVIAVDKGRDEVTVEVLKGLPAYDGMRCASAHAWDLATGHLKRFGRTPQDATLTIGTNITAYWQAVPGTSARRLMMRGAGFAAKLEIGDGVSWHHKASESFNQTTVMYSSDVVFDNIIMPNVSNMGMLAGYNHNLTFRKLRFEPENGNLAIGGRDGLHLSMNSGRLLVEDCVFKGLRMDPLVIRRSFGLVKETRPDGALLISPGYAVPAGDRIRFWIGEDPVDRAVTKSESVMGGTLYHFDGGAPPAAKRGTAVSYLTYSLDQGIIRNTLFADNFGSAIVNFEENITVEGCTFDNNAYQVKYGPNAESGGFARNCVVRGNVFLNTSWVDIARRGQPSSIVIHSLSKFFQAPRYNRNILIAGNAFKNPQGDPEAAAIDVRNARDVRIADNTFEGFTRHVVIDGRVSQ